MHFAHRAVHRMVGAGGFTLYEAVHRFFTPYVPRVDWFPFLAAILSAASGLVLWQYQRYVGKRSGLMAFIAESADSRNHILVALGVIAGLVASVFRFGILDMLVGFAIAVLILWSAIQLVVELVRSKADGAVDLSRYGFWMQDMYENARDRHLQNTILRFAEGGEMRNKTELRERVLRTVDFRDNPWMQAMGLDRQLAAQDHIERLIGETVQNGWVIDSEPVSLSEEGLQYLARSHRAHRRHGRRTPMTGQPDERNKS